MMDFRYLYADLYGGAIWEGTEFPKDSGNFTTSLLPFSCASDSPIKCSSVPGSSRPALGYVSSFGEDLKKNVYVLTSNGVYRVVRPSRCKYTCSKENTVKASNPSASPPSSTSPSHAIRLSKHIYISLILVLSLALALVV